MSKLSKRVGLIAEDESDVEALKEIIKRITGKTNIGFKNFVGRGCGKIKRKADDWAKQLKLRGCEVLIIIHDLDRSNYNELYQSIEDNLKPFVIEKTLVVIPIEEMESWFLSDSKAVKIALNLPKEIKIFHHPERIKSPKEVLGREIQKASNDSKIYINTKHNTLIAKHINIKIVKNKCKSFEQLHHFAVHNI